MCGHQALGQIIWLLLREYPEAPRLGVSPLKTFFTNRAEILLPAPSSSGIDTFTPDNEKNVFSPFFLYVTVDGFYLS